MFLANSEFLIPSVLSIRPFIWSDVTHEKHIYLECIRGSLKPRPVALLNSDGQRGMGASVHVKYRQAQDNRQIIWVSQWRLTAGMLPLNAEHFERKHTQENTASENPECARSSYASLFLRRMKYDTRMLCSKYQNVWAALMEIGKLCQDRFLTPLAYLWRKRKGKTQLAPQGQGYPHHMQGVSIKLLHSVLCQFEALK